MAMTSDYAARGEHRINGNSAANAVRDQVPVHTRLTDHTVPSAPLTSGSFGPTRSAGHGPSAHHASNPINVLQWRMEDSVIATTGVVLVDTMAACLPNVHD